MDQKDRKLDMLVQSPSFYRFKVTMDREGLEVVEKYKSAIKLMFESASEQVGMGGRYICKLSFIADMGPINVQGGPLETDFFSPHQFRPLSKHETLAHRDPNAECVRYAKVDGKWVRRSVVASDQSVSIYTVLSDYLNHGLMPVVLAGTGPDFVQLAEVLSAREEEEEEEF